MTFLTKQQEEIFKNITTIDEIELGEKFNAISFLIEQTQLVIDDIINTPITQPLSKITGEVQKCDIMNR